MSNRRDRKAVLAFIPYFFTEDKFNQIVKDFNLTKGAEKALKAVTLEIISDIDKKREIS